MKDVEKTTLRAFVLALAQQPPGQSLPANLLTSLQAIGQDLDHRVMDLHQLATETPSLAEPYAKARQWLTRQAAERGLGKDFLAATADEQPDQEQLNIARDVKADLAALQQVLAHLDDTHAAQILAAPDPVQALQAHLNSGLS